MKRRWIKQKPNSEICGQIAVAVITRLPLKFIIELMGGKATDSKEVSSALNILGYVCPSISRRMKPPILGIGHLRHKNYRSGGHWIVIDNGKFYDGLYGKPDGSVNWPKNFKVVSYLPIKLKA